MMLFNLLSQHVVPAQGENTVRTYHCTSLSSGWLRLKAEGYLTITNKRVIFYAFGSSYGGTSIFLSEAPIADISGINSYKGTSFSIMRLLTALVASFVVGSILNAIINTATLLLVRGDPGTIQGVSLFLPIAIAAFSFFFFKEGQIQRPILASTGAMVAFWLGGASMAGSFFSGFTAPSSVNVGGLTPFVIFGSGIYVLVTLYWYAKRESISLAIGSKGGSSTPITISGTAAFGLFNTAALQALTAEPAENAEVMIKELGAVITDIQQLGNVGIDKWTASSIGSSASRLAGGS